MSVITYASQFQPGQVVTGAALDAQFTAVTTGYASLNSDNFRRFAGITNDSKESAFAVSVLGTTIPSFTFTEADTGSYLSLFSYPHSQAVDTATTNAVVDLGSVPFVRPFRIKAAQIMWDGITGENAADSLRLVVTYAKAGTKNSGFGLAGSYAGGAVGTVGDGAISLVSYTVTDAIACHAYLYIGAYSAAAGTRTVTNLSAFVTLELPHV